MTQKTVAEILVETLIAAGVKRIYGVVGDSLNGILEEIRRSKKIDWIGVRHEETGASFPDACRKTSRNVCGICAPESAGKPLTTKKGTP